MYRHTQQGSALFVVLFILSLLMLVGSAGFGVWAYTERADYKNKSDAISAKAVANAEQAQRAKLAAEFAEQEKNPNKVYTGPDVSGTVSFAYPKTWSAYVDETGKSSSPLVGYFHPNFVPNLNDTSFALRVEVVNTSYDQVVKTYDSNIKLGKIKATAYVPKKLEGNKSVVPGLKLDGEIISQKQGSMILLKIRDKTLKVWTESNNFLQDYNSIIIPTLSIVP